MRLPKMRRIVELSALLMGAVGILTYFQRRRMFAGALRLPAPQFRVDVEHNLRVPMRDGVNLMADHFFPVSAESFPTVLIRSPYGREPHAGAFGATLAFIARRFAEQGYHVVTQDTRGRFHSGGEFDPVMNEYADGLDTFNWLSAQPWFNGVVGTWGPSYLGIVQLAVAAHEPSIKAMVPSVTGSDLHAVLYPDGAFDLGLAMRWLALFQALDRYQDKPIVQSASMLTEVEKAITPAFRHLPITEADQVALGKTVPYYQMWLEHPTAADPVWEELVKRVKVAESDAPTYFLGGWYDFFLRAMLADYTRLREAGKRPYLTIGPWHHFSNVFIMGNTVSEGVEWFDTHLKGKPLMRAKPVRIYVMGAREWRDLEDWPPPYRETRYYLHPRHVLAPEAPLDDSAVSTYRYNPANPTPALGGTQFSPFGGPTDNRPLEARADVLTFTTEPLQAPLEVIGPVKLVLYVCSSLPTSDFFGRLCDVHPNGRSVNICDGLFRVLPGKGAPQSDGSLRIEVDLWATAHRFKVGHSLRLLVASGAHPRWACNLGAENQLGTLMYIADQQIFHDRAHPSALVLPVPATP